MNLSKRKFLFAGIAIFWILIAVLNLSQTYLSSYARGWEFIWAEQLVYASGWALWIIYTPLIFILVKRNPVKGQIGWRFLMQNILIAMTFALIHCALDITLQFSLWNSFIEKKILSDFYGSFYYKYHVNVFIFLFVAGASYTVDYLRRSRQLEVEKARLENLLTEVKLSALKSQLQPHFLFNTHHNIVSLMMKGENEKAISMLTKLSDLLRKTLDQREEQFVLLKEELTILQTYLEIHQIRFSDRLRVEMDIGESLLNQHFPLLLLQPLVENALEYGISKSSDAGTIRIVIRRVNGKIHIRITDDGPGSQGPLQEGIGLTNTRNRLNHLFDQDFEFTASNLKPKGFKVEIRIPTIDERE